MEAAEIESPMHAQLNPGVEMTDVSPVSPKTGSTPKPREQFGDSGKNIVQEEVKYSFQDIKCTVQVTNTVSADKKVSADSTEMSDPAVEALGKLESGADRSNKSEKMILKGANGVAQKGEVLAVMGPSGAGKSSLLDILAGRKTVGQIEGCLMVNGHKVTPKQVRQMSAYVAQHDVLMPTLTVRETLQFVADLQISATDKSGKRVSKAERRARVDSVLEALDLEMCADTKVGGQYIRGISGGQQRRVSIGMEFLTSPCIIFLDEPTSGLDSAAALSLFKTLKRLASNKGMICIATIHQPRSDIVALFDRLMLLCDGYVCFEGAASEVQPFFGSFGLICPVGWNMADWMIDVLADKRSCTGAEWGQRFLASEQGAAAQERVGLAQSLDERGVQFEFRSKRVNSTFARQFRVLYWRHLTDAVRNPAVLGLQSFGYIAAAVFLGLLFSDLKVSVQSQLSLSFAFVAAIVAIFCFFAVPVYNQGRAVFAKEYASGYYRLPAHYSASMAVQLMMNIPLVVIYTAILAGLQGWDLSGARFGIFASIAVLLQLGLVAMNETIGAFFSNLFVALAVSALASVLAILFNGVICSYHNMPVYLRWLYWMSPTAYATSGFIGTNFDTGSPQSEGRLFLSAFDSPLTDRLGAVYGALVFFFCFWRVACFTVLRYCQQESR